MTGSLNFAARTVMLLLVTFLAGILPLTWSRAVVSLPELLPASAATLGIDLQPAKNDTVEYGKLIKRIPTEQSIIKGRRLHCLMSATIDHARQINGGVRLEEDFDEWEVLTAVADEDEGWSQHVMDPKYGSTGIQANLAALTNANPDDTDYQYFVHDRDGTVNGEDVSPTQAEFGNGINARGGVIIADTNTSPRYAKHYIPGRPISRIRQWSQAVYGEWIIVTNGAEVVGDLRFVIRSWVTNEQTQTQIIQALKDTGRNRIPGLAGRVTFDRMSTNQAEVDGFYALLGTPNGASTGFLLATHKGGIGIKTVRSIVVWNHPISNAEFNSPRDWLKLNMLFTFEVVTNPTTGEP